FPTQIPLYQQAFENWEGAIKVDDLWTCAPQTADDVCAVADWALAAGWRLRVRGSMHSFSPFVITKDTDCATQVVLIDLTSSLTAMEMVDHDAVRVEAGAKIEDLLAFLETHGRGFAASTAPGEPTVGGALALSTHGTGVRAHGESLAPGQHLCSLSNLVLQ